MKNILIIFILCVLCFSVHAQKWTKLGNAPIAPHNAAFGFTYSDKEYIVAGGLTSSVYSDTMWEYDPILNKWTFISTFPGGNRFALGGFLIGDKVYIGMGQDDKTYAVHNDFYSFNMKTKKWTTLSTFPGTPRYSFASFSIGKYGYIAGGTPGGPPYLNSAYQYNSVSDVWKAISSLPTPTISTPYGFVFNGSGYVIGGYNNPGGTRDMEKLDTLTNTWSLILKTPDSAHASQRSFVICNKLYLITGEIYDTNSVFYGGCKDVFTFDEKFNKLTKIGNFPGNAREHANAFNINGVGYLMMGLSDSGGTFNLFNDIWKFTVGSDTMVKHDTTFCTGNIIAVKGMGNYKYLWSTGDSSKQITVNASGIYWVHILNNKTCKNETDTFNVSVLKGPGAAVDSVKYMCTGDSVLLHARNIGFIFKWNTGDTTRTIKVGSAGVYWVKIGAALCSVTDTATVYTVSKPVLSLPHTASICLGYNALTLNAGYSPALYHWNTGDTTEAIAVHDTGIYWIKAKNNCGAATAIVHVNLDNNCCAIDLPNAFTPAYTINNIYRVISNCTFDAFEFRIYNRWGQQVFETQNYKQGWDGSFNGKPAPQDVYYWYMSYKKMGTDAKTMKGDVTLLR